MKYLLFLGLLLATAGCDANAQISHWAGRYHYTADLGKTAAGTPVIVDYDLTLGAPPSKECQLTIRGYQVDETITCDSAEIAGEQLDVRFKSYGDGSLTNKYGVTVYTPETTLFSLENKKHLLITHWQSLVPDEAMKTSGPYFKPVTGN